MATFKKRFTSTAMSVPKRLNTLPMVLRKKKGKKASPWGAFIKLRPGSVRAVREMIDLGLNRRKDISRFFGNRFTRRQQEAMTQAISGLHVDSKAKTIWNRVQEKFITQRNPFKRNDNGKVEPVRMESFASNSVARDIDNQVTYKEKVSFSAGEPNTMMKLAKEMYGTKSKMLHTTGYTKCLDQMDSRAGLNRRGFFSPWRNDLRASVSYLPTDYPLFVDNRGSLGFGQIAHFITNHGLPTTVLDYLATPGTQAQDLLFPIASTTSVHTYTNKMTYSPCDLSIYILRVRANRVVASPTASIIYDWANMTDTTTDPARWGPIFSQADASTSTDREKYRYVFPPDTKNISNSAFPSASKPASDQNYTYISESNTVLGYTPYFSPSFKELYETLDVKKIRLGAGDRFELTIHKEYDEPLSLRQLNDKFNFLGSVDKTEWTTEMMNYWSSGDIEVLCSFAGAPGLCYGPSSDGANESTVLTADALKSAITHEVSHTIDYHFQSMDDLYRTPSQFNDNLTKCGWVTTTERSTTTERLTAMFGQSGAAIVSTSLTKKNGGLL